jgi:hypothetical protein
MRGDVHVRFGGRAEETVRAQVRHRAPARPYTDRVDLSSWPQGTRLICRKERAHPGAQFKFTDLDGHRFTCFLTDTEGDQIAELELRHRRRARIEDAIRCGKECGMRNLPFHDFTANTAWLELSLIAQDLLAWSRALVLTGELALAEPKRLRQSLSCCRQDLSLRAAGHSSPAEELALGGRSRSCLCPAQGFAASGACLSGSAVQVVGTREHLPAPPG